MNCDVINSNNSTVTKFGTFVANVLIQCNKILLFQICVVEWNLLLKFINNSFTELCLYETLSSF